MSDQAPPDTTPSEREGHQPPDYVSLVKFLVEPFLESPESLKIDCEVSPRTSKVLLRLAFEGEDKGRVFGRGGRNIQAIKTVLQAVAQSVGHSAYLDVYGSQSMGASGKDGGSEDSSKPPPRSRPRPSPRVRSDR